MFTSFFPYVVWLPRYLIKHLIWDTLYSFGDSESKLQILQTRIDEEIAKYLMKINMWQKQIGT